MSEAISIHLVVGNLIARKLIAAWPMCVKDGIEKWIKTAISDYNNLKAEEYRRTAEMLMKTEICRKDGTVNDYVAKYLNALAMKELGIKKK